MSVRVRIAPSPTGEPHIGTMRTAIFDWLLSRHEGGEFVVRIEDTDQTRYVPESVEALTQDLDWLGIPGDEGPLVGGPYGPYVQSERLPLYQEAAERLVEQGHAYRCYCTKERLEKMRKAQQAAKQPPRYDRRCRWLTPEERQRHESAGEPWTVRFAVPLEGETTVYDLIRGEITFPNESQDDFIIVKSDGFPVYHLAVVVDDHAMQITHVLRGDEWLPSFPKHLLLYQALSYPMPAFAHLPLILGKDRSKLSKRHGDTAFSVFRREGYLPDAVFNFLALLGWSLDDKTEIISREEFVAHFTLARVNKSPAIFDVEKLRWMNGVYIRMLPLDELARAIAERLDVELPADVPRPLDLEYVGRLAPLVHERIKLLSEVTSLVDFFFVGDPPQIGRVLLLGKRFAADAPFACEALEATLAAVRPIEDWCAAQLERAIEPLVEGFGLKKGDLYGLIRVAVTGKTVTPPLFESMEVLGRSRTLANLDSALHLLDSA